ncbi:aldehyde dehydrogenase family protein [Stakelama pacifica]|uniref:Aldehyde dehydrogenase (NAD+) n=1 Tax=Stakelama pacifica TaxID=517720 RepID=A0A4R6FD94_9SPHN|nr:aldehyde dehydrogenase family protein [Stakelama pacifica]TDN78264.1 aldehyde dehydrogenase (NAD+) [Stakelama pacifica]GGO99764.1 dehydrogenase [Stakelama pacifica]
MHDNLIGGDWVGSSSLLSNINPSDITENVGNYAKASQADVARAAEAARAAFPAWRNATAQLRADILAAAGEEILARRDELGALLAREEGKVLAEAIGEVVRAGRIFRFFAGEAVRTPGEILPQVRLGVDVEVTREPVGVVGIITPWNFPIAIPAWKIAPALAFGNCVLFKPSELTPAMGWMLTDILLRAGLPRGVLSLLMGEGRDVGAALVETVDAISFTGSVQTGHSIMAAASQRMPKLQLEMGGKNPLIVLDDADLTLAAEVAANGAFGQTGQRCTASSRLIVTAGIHDRFVAALQERLEAFVVDNAMKPGSQIGPVIDQRQLDKNQNYIEIAKSEGAKVYGGELLQRDTPGFYMRPCLFLETNSGMRINREEIFGPIASVVRAANYEEALAIANDTEYGLSAGICTTSLKYAQHFRRHVEAGLAMVNLPTAGLDYHAPFGGTKASSFGPREQGSYAVDFYTVTKTAYISPG